MLSISNYLLLSFRISCMKLSSHSISCALLGTGWLNKITSFSNMNSLQYLFACSAKSAGRLYLLMSSCFTTRNLSHETKNCQWRESTLKKMCYCYWSYSLLMKNRDFFSFYAFYFSRSSYLVQDLVT